MVKPAHLRLMEAYEQCLQEGKNPTDAVIAAKLSVRRETVTRWRRRRPDLWTWVYGRLGEFALQMRPVVDRRVTALAIQGSAEHTKLYYQFVAKVGTPLDDELPGGRGAAPVQVNILVPHPQLPNGGRLPALPGVTAIPAAAPPVSRPVPHAIPTVSVR